VGGGSFSRPKEGSRRLRLPQGSVPAQALLLHQPVQVQGGGVLGFRGLRGGGWGEVGLGDRRGPLYIGLGGTYRRLRRVCGNEAGLVGVGGPGVTPIWRHMEELSEHGMQGLSRMHQSFVRSTLSVQEMISTPRTSHLTRCSRPGLAFLPVLGQGSC